jgi:hypothetical protein
VLSFGVISSRLVGFRIKNVTRLVNRDHLVSYSQGLLGGLVGAALLGTVASANSVSTFKENPLSTAEAPLAVRPIADGLYYFGSADHPDEIGHAYMVFEAENSQLTGAIFMPQSSFDCFRGQVVNNELALQITNSYTQEVYDYPIALTTAGDPIATVGTPQLPLQLSGFYDLGTLRETESELLAICQSSFADVEI